MQAARSLPCPGRRTMPVLAVPLLVALALAAGCARERERAVQRFTPPAPLPGVALALEAGDSLVLARGDGRPALVTFGYAACPDVCPTTLADWARARARLGRDGARVRFVFVTVDWRHERAADAARFARRFDPAFTGAAADSAAAAALLPAFHGEAGYGAALGAEAGELGHTAYSYLVDGEGRLAVLFPFAAGPNDFARELRAALRR